MRRYRRAKIVATVGPASSSPEMLKKLNQAGVDTFRLNFSHGTHDDHARVHAAIRALESEVGHPIGILQDLQGPKIRVGTIRDGKIEVEAGETVRFVRSGSDGGRGASAVAGLARVDDDRFARRLYLEATRQEVDIDAEEDESISILACLAHIEAKEACNAKPKRGGSRLGRRKTKPRMRAEGHCML